MASQKANGLSQDEKADYDTAEVAWEKKQLVPNLMSGEYGTCELAKETLKNATKPDRFENYQEHLQTAKDPVLIQ